VISALHFPARFSIEQRFPDRALQPLSVVPASVSEIRHHPKGVLNVNAPVSFGQTVLPAIIADFLQ